MRTIAKFSTGVALLFAYPALACDLETATGPSGPVRVPAESLTVVGATPTAAFQNLSGVLMGNTAFNGSGCSAAQVQAALAANNPTIAGAATVPAGAMFVLVRPRVAPAAPPPPPPAAAAPAAVAPPVTAAPPPAPVRAAPAVDYNPRIQALEGQLATLRARPATTPAAASLRQEQITALEGQLAAVQQAKAAAEAAAQQAATSAGASAASATAAKGSEDRAAVHDTNAAASAAAAANSASLLSGIWNWVYGFLGVILLFGAGFGIFVYFNNRRLKAIEDNSVSPEDFNKLKARMEVSEEKIENVLEQGGYKVITLEAGWYQKVTNLTEGEETGLQILLDGEAEFTTLVSRGDADNCYIKAGIKGQQPLNVVKIGNLEKIVRSACKPDNFRLSNKIGGADLKAAA